MCVCVCVCVCVRVHMCVFVRKEIWGGVIPLYIYISHKIKFFLTLASLFFIFLIEIYLF